MLILTISLIYIQRRGESIYTYNKLTDRRLQGYRVTSFIHARLEHFAQVTKRLQGYVFLPFFHFFSKNALTEKETHDIIPLTF